MRHTSDTRTPSRAAIALVVVVICLVSAFLLGRMHPLRLDLSFATTSPGPAKIFHAPGNGFTEERSGTFQTMADGQVHDYRVDIRDGRDVTALRLDLGTGPGMIALRSVEIQTRVLGMGSPKFRLPLLAKGLNDVRMGGIHDGALRVMSTGIDPFFRIDVPRSVQTDLGRWRTRTIAFVCLALGAAASLLCFIMLWIGRRRLRITNLLHSFTHRLQRPASWLSDPGAVVLKPTSLLVLVALCALALGGIVARLTFSSVGMWDSYLPGTATASTVVGTPRAIRSDEWLVFTPWMLSQASTGMHESNPNVGGGEAPLLVSIPVHNTINLFQPEFYGFSMFDAERAMSWYWMYRALGLFAASFLLLLFLTGNHAFASILGATWLCGSSYMQWWFSTNISQLVLGFCLTLLGFFCVAYGTRRRTLLGGAVALLVGTTTFAFHLYPPVQVPLVYLAATILAGVGLQRGRPDGTNIRPWVRLATLGACGAVVALLLWRFWVDAGPTIGMVFNTTYPGERFLIGGTMAWTNVFDGIFEAWRHGEQSYPYALQSNASESSDYVMLFPLVLVALGWSWCRAKPDALVLALALFCVALAAWMIVPLPPSLATLVSRLSLFSFVQPSRATATLGIASIFLCTIWFARMQPPGREPLQSAPTFVWLLVVLATFQFGAIASHVDATFFTGWRVLLGCIAVALGSVALGRGNRRAFIGLVALVTLPAATVNPVARGLSPLLQKPAMVAAVEASGQRKDPVWMVMDSIVIPQAFKANGMQVFGGATFVPDVARMHILDPVGTHRAIWNRYAHIEVTSEPGRVAPGFTLLQQDAYRMVIDVCSPLIRQLGVTHLAYLAAAPEADMRCLTSIGEGPIGGLWLYTRD